MTSDSLADMDTDATKEYGQERKPGQIFPKCLEEVLVLGAVAEDSEGNDTGGLEDDDDAEPDVE